MPRSFRKLTRDAVQRIPRGKSLSENGIIAERLRDGDVRWTVNIMVSGTRIHRVIGRQSEGASRERCEDFIAAARTDERNDRLNLPKRRKTRFTFEELARRYLNRAEATKAKNLRHKKPQIEKKLIPYFGAHPATAITKNMVDAYKQARLQQPGKNGKGNTSAGTVNRELATLKHIFREAVAEKELSAVPCKIKLLDEPAGRLRVLSEDECAALITAARADEDPDLWLFIAFGLNTSMRHREILQARFDQIDWARRRLHVPKAKAGMREQPLTPALVELLKAERDSREDKNGFIFRPLRTTSRSKLGHRPSMRGPFARAVKAAKLDPKEVTPHVMRHTAITRLVEAGVPLPTIQQISGHKSMSMVLRYAHVSAPHVDTAIAALASPATTREAFEKGANDSLLPNGDTAPVSQDLHTGPSAGAAGKAA